MTLILSYFLVFPFHSLLSLFTLLAPIVVEPKLLSQSPSLLSSMMERNNGNKEKYDSRTKETIMLLRDLTVTTGVAMSKKGSQKVVEGNVAFVNDDTRAAKGNGEQLLHVNEHHNNDNKGSNGGGGGFLTMSYNLFFFYLLFNLSKFQ